MTQKGLSREDSYAFVQRNAMPVWRGEGDFLTLLKADPDVSKALSTAELEELFDLGYHFKHVDTIFARVFGVAERYIWPIEGEEFSMQMNETQRVPAPQAKVWAALNDPEILKRCIPRLPEPGNVFP